MQKNVSSTVVFVNEIERYEEIAIAFELRPVDDVAIESIRFHVQNKQQSNKLIDVNTSAYQYCLCEH